MCKFIITIQLEPGTRDEVLAYDFYTCTDDRDRLIFVEKIWTSKEAHDFHMQQELTKAWIAFHEPKNRSLRFETINAHPRGILPVTRATPSWVATWVRLDTGPIDSTMISVERRRAADGATDNVRNLDATLVEALKARAARNGRSAEAEHRRILEAALAEGDGMAEFAAAAARLRDRFASGLDSTELIRAARDARRG